MSRSARRRAAPKVAGFVGLSMVAHVGLLFLLTHLLLMQVTSAPEEALVYSVDPVAGAEDEAHRRSSLTRPLMEDEVDPREEPRARVGDPSASADRLAADTLSDSKLSGSVAGEGQPRPHPDPLAGDDLDDLRFRPFNHLTRDSLSRIRTRRRAVTYDNERATPNPEPTPFLTTGRGTSDLRHPRTAPRNRMRSHRSRAGLDPGTSAPGGEDSPGAATLSSRLTRRMRGGNAALARRRPDVPRSTPRTLTVRRWQAVADRRNREQASSRRHPDLVEMGRPRGHGDSTGAGKGGEAGRRGDATGERHGLPIWLHTPDRRYVRYFRKVHGKIQPLWVFPKKLEVQLLQGDAQVSFTILASGKVTNIRLKKSSGFPQFDRLVMGAVARAAPFAPIPRGLGKRLTIVAPFEFHNPMVR